MKIPNAPIFAVLACTFALFLNENSYAQRPSATESLVRYLQNSTVSQAALVYTDAGKVLFHRLGGTGTPRLETYIDVIRAFTDSDRFSMRLILRLEEMNAVLDQQWKNSKEVSAVIGLVDRLSYHYLTIDSRWSDLTRWMLPNVSLPTKKTIVFLDGTELRPFSDRTNYLTPHSTLQELQAARASVEAASRDFVRSGKTEDQLFYFATMRALLDKSLAATAFIRLEAEIYRPSILIWKDTLVYVDKTIDEMSVLVGRFPPLKIDGIAAEVATEFRILSLYNQGLRTSWPNLLRVRHEIDQIISRERSARIEAARSLMKNELEIVRRVGPQNDCLGQLRTLLGLNVVAQ